MLFRLRVSLPVAVMVKLCPIADSGAVIVKVSLALPVYPEILTPEGRFEEFSVYPLLMFVSFN